MEDGSTPRGAYQRILEERRQKVRQQERLEQLIGNGRVLVFLFGLLQLWIIFGAHLLPPWTLVLPVILFVGLTGRFDRVGRDLQRARRAAAIYERGLARLEGRWKGQGEQGLRFQKVDHPYALDLDLFGAGSLYERLCAARTRAGEDTLAEWLLGPTTVEQIRERQDAIRELRHRLDLRESLELLGGEARAVANPDGLVAWGLAPAVLFDGWQRRVTIALPVLTFIGFGVWATYPARLSVFLTCLVSELAFSAWMRARVEQVTGAVENKARDLALLAGVLHRLELEEFGTEPLRRLRAALVCGGEAPSVRISRLSRLVERLEWRHNQVFAPVAAILLWSTHHAFRMEAWRASSGTSIRRWLDAVGQIEALSSLARYSYENPEDPFPDLIPQGALLEGEEVGHPLLPRGECVRNSVQLGSPIRLLVVSGSNMSGKSTLLRTVGINAVLALAGAPVHASRLRLSPMNIGATLRIQDSLQDGYSRFYAEVTRIKRLVELVQEPLPLLFLLDEIFQGTNSHDRKLGAEAVVTDLVRRGAIGLVTTHDLALTQIAERLSEQAANVHFEDHLEDGRIVFDYSMRPGIVKKSNALALMRAVGLNVPGGGPAAGNKASDGSGTIQRSV